MQGDVTGLTQATRAGRTDPAQPPQLIGPQAQPGPTQSHPEKARFPRARLPALAAPTPVKSLPSQAPFTPLSFSETMSSPTM